MSTLSRSPMLKTTQSKAPQPSPALLALQEKGLELSRHTNKSISPPYLHESLDQNTRVSPFSLTSTTSGQDQPHVVEPQDGQSRRSSSAGSASTTVTKILNLYINVSDWSLQSEYEEITPYPDDEDEDVGPDIPTVHQPKAYRDTIAPLLEHQFSNYNLAVPAVKSPQSFVSLPKLLHPNANSSVVSLHLEPDTSSNTERKISDTSIQITPDITPPPPSTNYASAPSFQKYSQELAQRKIALEVPDVRTTGPWYDQPVSPTPLTTQADNRESYESATTVISIDYERQMAYDTLAPPITRKSPQIGPVSVVHDGISLQPSSAMMGDIVKLKNVPPPLDLSRTRSLSRSNEERTAAQQAQREFQRDQETKHWVQEAGSEQRVPFQKERRPATPANSFPHKSSETPLRTSGTTGTTGLGKAESGTAIDTISDTSKDNMERLSSAFSSESDDSFVIHDTFRGHLKAIWRHKFNKKEKAAKHTVDASRGQSEPGDTSHSSPRFVDDPDSYKYPYKLPDGSNSSQPQQSFRGHDHDNMRSKVVGSLEDNQQADTSLRYSGRQSLQRAVPLTRYQKYGPEIWYESKKEKRREEREAAKKAAAAEAAKAPAQVRPAPSLARNENADDSTLELTQIRPSSIPLCAPKTSTDDSNEVEAGARKVARKSRASQNYNDSIFEASGGRKKSGFASRLLMSSEEKRKLKVKESILVLGSARMSAGKQVDRGSSSSVKPLVRL